MSTISPSQSTHLRYLDQALSRARLSPPKPTNFRVGCLIVSFPSKSTAENEVAHVISSGYTLELEGNTHAEQNALAKLARENGVSIENGEEALEAVLTEEVNAHLYTTLEPCGLRLSGATPCVQRIIATRKRTPKGGIRKVIFGAREPGTFVQDSQSLRMLDEAGIEWEYVEGMEDEILAVAKQGHTQSETSTAEAKGTRIDDISPEERRRQEQQPRNPKKRMMEVDLLR